jgi:hypothetical protein
VRDLPLDAADVLPLSLPKALTHANIRWDVLELADLAADSNALRAFDASTGWTRLAIYHHDSNRLHSLPGQGDECFAHIAKDHLKKNPQEMAQAGATGRAR